MTTRRGSFVKMTTFVDSGYSGFDGWYHFTSLFLICYIFSMVNIDIIYGGYGYDG